MGRGFLYWYIVKFAIINSLRFQPPTDKFVMESRSFPTGPNFDLGWVSHTSVGRGDGGLEIVIPLSFSGFLPSTALGAASRDSQPAHTFNFPGTWVPA